MTITIFLADDHPVVRQGLQRLIELDPDFRVVGESGDGLDTVQQLERMAPDILVVDLMMPSLSGLDVTRQVLQRLPGLQVIILSMHEDDAYVLQALRHGARGYVLKDSNPAELSQAIHEVYNGRRFLSARIASRLIDAFLNQTAADASQDPYETLTDREREVLHLTVEGFTAADIATRLSISPRTAETHRANLMKKLGINSQLDLIRYAIKRGILMVD